jgi:hypothetical protein
MDGSAAPAGSAHQSAAAAWADIGRVTRRARTGVYWQAGQWLLVALFLVASLLVQHAYPRYTRWFLIGSVAVLVVAAVLLHWRSRAVDRGSARRDKVAGWWFIGLYAAAGFLLSQGWPAPHLSPGVVAIAVAPAVPALLAAAWVLRR